MFPAQKNEQMLFLSETLQAMMNATRVIGTLQTKHGMTANSSVRSCLRMNVQFQRSDVHCVS